METYRLRLDEEIEVNMSTQKIKNLKIIGLIFELSPALIMVYGIYSVLINIFLGNYWAPLHMIGYAILAFIAYGISIFEFNIYHIEPLYADGPDIFISGPIVSAGNNQNPLVVHMHLRDLERLVEEVEEIEEIEEVPEELPQEREK